MKKRILSLILALSMVLSVLPLGAFAADPPPQTSSSARTATRSAPTAEKTLAVATIGSTVITRAHCI